MSGSKFAQKHSIRARAKALAEQVTELYGMFEQFTNGADRILTGHDRRLFAVEETVQALVRLYGDDEVANEIMSQRTINGEARVAAEAATLEVGVKEGYMIPVDIIDEEAYLVGVEHDKEGKLLAYGPQQTPYAKATNEFKPLLIGKKIGDIIDTPTGGKFQITAIYHIDDVKLKAVMEAKVKEQKDATDAAAVATTVAAEASETAAEATEAAAEAAVVVAAAEETAAAESVG